MSDDKYINLAINAVLYIRENPNTDPEIKEFTYIVVQMLESMERWEDIKEHEECCNIVLYAFEEYEKVNYGGCSRMMRGIFRSLQNELIYYLKSVAAQKSDQDESSSSVSAAAAATL